MLLAFEEHHGTKETLNASQEFGPFERRLFFRAAKHDRARSLRIVLAKTLFGIGRQARVASPDCGGLEKVLHDIAKGVDQETLLQVPGVKARNLLDGFV